MPREIEIFIDGASKGNPGPSGIGVVICEEGKPLKNISSYIGKATNNVAEYTAMLYALEEALALKADIVKINTDSQLLYKQIKKTYKIKSPNIIGLYNRVTRLMAAFSRVIINNIPRENNLGADKLANRGIKKALKFSSFK